MPIMISIRPIKLFLLPLCVIFCTSGVFVQNNEHKQLPEYYNEYLESIVDEILLLKSDEADCFFYWTDTHFPENSGYAPAIMCYIQDKVGAIKKFYGGDSIKNAPSLSPGMDLFTSTLIQAGQYNLLYPVRGNHDFISTTSDSVSRPEIMDNLQTWAYLDSFCSPDVVKDESVATSNYYYLDSNEGRIRYIVFDTTEITEEGTVKYGITDGQMEWVFNQAVSTLPAGWSIMFISHVPLSAGHVTCEEITRAGDKIAEMASGTNILLCLSGHRHSDITTAIGPVLQVLTESDCLVDCARTITPYSNRLEKKSSGTINEQTLDYVSISMDHKKVTFKRIGHGFDRVFNVTPIIAKSGDIVKLPAVSENPVHWTIYDAEIFSIGSYDETGYRKMYLVQDSVELMDNNFVRYTNVGNYIAVAVEEDGTKNYFITSVQP